MTKYSIKLEQVEIPDLELRNKYACFQIKIKEKDGVHFKKGEVTALQLDDVSADTAQRPLFLISGHPSLTAKGFIFNENMLNTPDGIGKVLHVTSMTTDLIMVTDTILGYLWVVALNG